MSLIFKGFLALSLVLSLWSCQGMTSGLTTGLNADSSDPDSDDTILADSGTSGGSTGSEGYGLSDSAMDPASDPLMDAPDPEYRTISGSPSGELDAGSITPLEPDGSAIERSDTSMDAVPTPIDTEPRPVVAAEGGTVGAPHDYEAVNPENIAVLFWPEATTVPWTTPREFINKIRRAPAGDATMNAIAQQAQTIHFFAWFPENVARNRTAERRLAAEGKGYVYLDQNVSDIIKEESLLSERLRTREPLVAQLGSDGAAPAGTTETAPTAEESAPPEPEHCSYFDRSAPEFREWTLCTTREQLTDRLQQHVSKPLFQTDGTFGPGYYLVFAIKASERDARSWPTLFANFQALKDAVHRHVIDPNGHYELNGDFQVSTPDQNMRTRLLLELYKNKPQDSPNQPIYIFRD